MKFLRWLPIAFAAVGISSTAMANYSSPDEFNERDFESVMNFIKCKRSIPLQEKSCDLMISGDIRFEWEAIKEKRNGIRQRGKDAPSFYAYNRGERIPTNQFDVEFNLMFDYRGSCTWAVAHLEFDNNAGIEINPRGCCGTFAEGCKGKEDHASDIAIADVREMSELELRELTPSAAMAAEYPAAFRRKPGDFYASTHLHGDPEGCHGSGTWDRLCLRKAFFGWNVFEECNCRLDIEVGRRALYDVFDSRVMFRSMFDGVLLRYTNCFECVGDFYTNLGFFVIDENSNHWGWALEAGLLDIADYGIDLKYSFIHWAKNGENRCGVDDPIGMRHKVSQLYGAYNFNPEMLCTRAKIYGAFIMNHDADEIPYEYFIRENDNQATLPSIGDLQFSNYKVGKNDIAWYLGFMVGDVCKEGDWSFDINWQYVEVNAFPHCDLTGVGLGNVNNIPFTINPAFGWLNYQGFRAEALYALTDNLVLHPSFEYSTNIKDFPSGNDLGFNVNEWTNVTPGGAKTDTDYSKFELEIIYAF